MDAMCGAQSLHRWFKLLIPYKLHGSFLEPTQWVLLSQSLSEQGISTHMTMLASQSPNINITQSNHTVSYLCYTSAWWESTPNQCNASSFCNDAKLASPCEAINIPMHVTRPGMLCTPLAWDTHCLAVQSMLACL